MPKEERFKMAGNMQGSLLSQTMFEILKSQYPDYSDVYFEQSVAFNKYGNHARGFELLDQAVELDPEMHLGYRGYMKLRFLRDFNGALKDFNRLDSLTPNFVDAPWGEGIDFLRGECYFGKKDYPKAIEMFNRNIEHHKEDWADIHSFVYLGLCEYELGNYEKAISEFKRALKQSEYTPESYFGMAKVYQKLGEIEKANENISKAEKFIHYKRENEYNEYLSEIYLWELLDFKQQLK
ncbi:tetratricopeptide repeat protein [Marivirga sp. S37H4]|uniref:Tetratricopeptide repeat protein n=1 Tax=Marivirga aurantiaca TaxID=2802615 RepID=A0A935C9S0_9BACT|nr:tetratricopeptide repeat protein [Marivirga aurantiaca]MBK6266139.1 tetratricopeptide repeat protein [Marivirga aurantiaca]